MKKLLNILRRIVLFPFLTIRNIFIKLKAKKAFKNKSRLETIEEYINLCNKYNLTISVANNYDNALIINIQSPNIKQTKAKRVTEKEKSEG